MNVSKPSRETTAVDALPNVSGRLVDALITPSVRGAIPDRRRDFKGLLRFRFSVQIEPWTSLTPTPPKRSLAENKVSRDSPPNLHHLPPERQMLGVVVGGFDCTSTCASWRSIASVSQRWFWGFTNQPRTSLANPHCRARHIIERRSQDRGAPPWKANWQLSATRKRVSRCVMPERQC